MTQYIDKSVLVAEIERRKNQFMSQADNFHSLGMEEKRDHFAVLASNMHSILSFIDTLEVKEVDLKEEVERFAKASGYKFAATIDFQFAEHFFALGMAVSNKAQKGEEV